MEAIAQKLFLQLKMPTEEIPVSDEKRIKIALDTLGYSGVIIPLYVLRKLYPMCRQANYDITVTLVHREEDWVMVNAEPGDTRNHHYGLAIDYGSTTIVMQLVDLNSGVVVAHEQTVNGQTAFGTDILTRITYAMEDASHVEDLHRVTAESIHRLLSALTENSGIDASRCPVMVLSGNTTMIHFLLKLDAWTGFASLYAPVVTEPGFFWGKELELDFSGPSQREVLCIEKFISGWSEDLASGLFQTSGSPESCGEYVLCSVRVYSGLFGPDAGGKVCSPYGYGALSQRSEAVVGKCAINVMLVIARSNGRTEQASRIREACSSFFYRNNYNNSEIL